MPSAGNENENAAVHTEEESLGKPTVPKEPVTAKNSISGTAMEEEGSVGGESSPFLDPRQESAPPVSDFDSKSIFSLPISRIPKLRQFQKPMRKPVKPFRLMDLPTELRLNILAHHFGKRTVAITYNGQLLKRRNWFVHGRQSEKNHQSWGGSISDDDCQSGSKSRSDNNWQSDHNHLAVLLACHQLQQESEDVLFDCTTFIVKVEGPSSVRNGRRQGFPSSLLQQLPDSMLDKIKKAIFHIDIYSLVRENCESPPKPPNILKDVAEMPSLNSVELHFDFNFIRHPELVDGIFALFQTMADESRLAGLSSVRVWSNKEMPMGSQRQYIPFNDMESYGRLLEKSDAIDVSEQECGGNMLSLANGVLRAKDTSIVRTS